MAEISGISSTVSTSTSQQTGPKALGQDDFLKLLVTQLKNQDPLKPTDNAEFISQLAQFSQLEQSSKQADLLQKSLDAQTAFQEFSLVPMIGRTVTVGQPLIQLGSTPATFGYTLDKNATKVNVGIMDSQGKVVRSLEYRDRPSGANVAKWDGKDNNGVSMQSGLYRYVISATDLEGKTVKVDGTAMVTVSGVRMDQGQAKLLVGDLAIDPATVVELR
ncbi:MAG: flagellar hook assembly protein FlgD [Nitrospira sp.]|nr:flagellar hook assembly protein FlgD [Nitrospira sp.]